MLSFFKAIFMFGLGAMSMLVSLTFWGIIGRIRHNSRHNGTNISGGNGNDTIINITTPENENRRK